MKSCVLLALLAFAAVASARELTAAGPCTGKKDGTLVAAGGCSAKYYQCWKGKPVDTKSTTCPRGQAFNPITKPQGCALVGAVGLTGCNCNIYAGNSRKACQARQKSGNFPLPGNKNGYVECSTQGAFVQKCNGNLKAQNCL
ncbi:hypothetical protein CHLNCDRAFT_136910 [Chlorella variabilis]|uniref:Chitin-binding type-2 domain-containing protein n=1 Tax=Chlorella variabilis TaxID=554065 RepID=E1ZLJ9_CHLVA|nr:hypothetical protein CHLNCDRAFT_136910 [Chlorella variabilis]EFN53146.1 hypothetical protein CHLNCDRAFT_136910 [Chlorella variabilis]|eukprot:XP_005845248.1 hypothetical protein CHLNCDRAFT_136910 [Chlorella variabilis]